MHVPIVVFVQAIISLRTGVAGIACTVAVAVRLVRISRFGADVARIADAIGRVQRTTTLMLPV